MPGSERTPVRSTRSDGTIQWASPGFLLTYQWLSHGVVYLAMVGSTDTFVEEAADLLDAEIALCGQILIFANLAEASRVGANARDGWATWVRDGQNRMTGHCLVRSKLVEMALSVIAMFSGSAMRSYSDSAAFEAAMRRAAPNAVLPRLRGTAA